MATTDYDTPRKTDDELAEDSIEDLKTRRAEAVSRQPDLGDGDSGPIELPGADLSGEELTVRVIPRQADEFTCSSCYLVHHRTRLARDTRRGLICKDCFRG